MDGLPKPDWATADGRVVLYNRDCMEVLPHLGSVDAVVTDPPYGVLDETWDDMTRRELARFTMGWASYVAKLTDKAFVFFGERTRSVVSPILSALYPDVRQIIWNKLGGHIAEDKLFYSFESIYYCHTDDTWEVAEPKVLEVGRLIAEARAKVGISRGGVDMLVRGKKTGLCYRWEEGACFPTTEQADVLRRELKLNGEFDAALSQAASVTAEVLQRARAETKSRAARACDVLSHSPPSVREHPTQKPLDLMIELVELAGDAGTTILDPFTGSGTTALACIMSGRKFIGCEDDPSHFATACRRIEAELNRAPLFDPAPIVQRSLITD